MKEQILQAIDKDLHLTDEEEDIFISKFKEVRVRKRQFIIQPDFTAKRRYFIVNGAFRAYIICFEGKEHTINIAIDNDWITDYNSYIFQEPATLFVVATEDSTILQLEYESEKHLKSTNHKFETFFRLLAERGLAFQQSRIISNLTQTAESRYENFVKSYPEKVQRFPQYAIASYLGMTTEFLSRIRNRRT